MTQPGANPLAIQQPLSLGDVRLYLATAAMVLGNVLLPYAIHRIPDGGRIFLPIFFFTLIAGWRFGIGAAILTGLLSPLANHLLTGMPPAQVLPSLIGQSVLLGVLAAVAAARSRKLTLPVLAGVVVVHQALILLPRLLQSGVQPALASLSLRVPGILFQILGGFALLWFMGRHLPGPERSSREG